VPAGDRTPPRVQQVIEDHVHRLSPAARDLMRVAAVVGRAFDADLVATVAGVDVGVRALDELWRSGLIRDRGDAAYDFAHDQIRLVAYDSTSPATRRSLHRGVARALGAAPGGPGTSAARIAHHLDRAGDADEAVTWYLRAAADAHRLSGSHEAVRALERAHVLLLGLPVSVERHRRELALLTALPAPLASIEGYASQRISTVQDSALRVARLAGAEPGAPLLWSLAFTGLVREDFPAARGYAEQLHDRGVRDGSASLVAEGACLLGIAAFWQADLATAHEWFERALRSARPEDTVHHLATYGQDPRTVALARLANVRALLGDPAGARAACDEALAAADALGHPLSRSAAHVFAALLGLDLDDDGLVRRCTHVLQESGCDAVPIRYVERALTGYVDVLDGSTGAGLASIDQVVDEASRAPAAPGMAALLLRIRLAAAVASEDPALSVGTARRLCDDAGPGRLWHPVAERVLRR
jgi:tetratricopeptide (TPR) repeat protein